MVRPVGYVHHVVPFRPKALPKPIMKLLPLFPGYEKKRSTFVPITLYFCLFHYSQIFSLLTLMKSLRQSVGGDKGGRKLYITLSQNEQYLTSLESWF